MNKTILISLITNSLDAMHTMLEGKKKRGHKGGSASQSTISSQKDQ